MHPAKLMTAHAPLPPGARLLGWIDRHPHNGNTLGYAVLQFCATGIECAWDGLAITSLPRDWRRNVHFEAAECDR